MIGFKETKIGFVPDDWEIKSLDEIGDDFIGGGTPSTKISDYWGGNTHWTTSKRLSDNIYLNNGEKKITKLGLENSSTSLVPKNNLIISTRVSVGKVAINSIDIAISQDLTGVIIDYNKYDIEFLAYQIKTNRVQIIFESHKRGATIKGITREDLKKIKLVIPKLEEQNNIAYILSKIQSAIETQEKIIQTTTELKKALMQKLFAEGLRGEPQKETEIGLVPKSWEIKKIRELVLETETRNPEKEPHKCIKYIDVSSVSNDTFSVICHQDFLGKDAPGRARKVVNTDDVIFATIRPTLKRVAKIMPEYDDQYCSTAFCVLRVGKNRLDFEYLYQYLLTDFFIKEIGKLQSGASYPAVRDNDVKRMKIPYPSIEEQEKIGSILKQLDCKKTFAIKKSLLLQSLFKSMLHHLMTGQIRVKDLRVS